MNKPQRTSRGFTLVEVLVAVLVLALGLVGIASLQVHGLRNFKESGDAQAVSLHLNALVEMMRLNADNADGYAKTLTGTCSSVPDNDQAYKDLCAVYAELDGLLSNDALELTVSDCSFGSSCTIEAFWTPRATYGANVSPSSTSFALDVFL